MADKQAADFEQCVAQYQRINSAVTDLDSFASELRSMVVRPSDRSEATAGHLVRLKEFHAMLGNWAPIAEPRDFLVELQKKLMESIQYCRTLIEMVHGYLEQNHSFPSLAIKMQSGAMQMLEGKYADVQYRIQEFFVVLKQLRKMDVQVEGELYYLQALLAPAEELAQQYAKCQVENKRMKMEVEEYKEQLEEESNLVGDQLMEQLIGATVQLDDHDCRAVNILSPEYREVELTKRTKYKGIGLTVQENHLQSLTAAETKWLHRKQQAESRLRLVSMQKHAMLGVVGTSLSKKQQKEQQDHVIARIREQKFRLEQQEKLARGNYIQSVDCNMRPGRGRPPAIGAQYPAFADLGSVPHLEELDDVDDDEWDADVAHFDSGQVEALPDSSLLRLPGPNDNGY